MFWLCTHFIPKKKLKNKNRECLKSLEGASRWKFDISASLCIAFVPKTSQKRKTGAEHYFCASQGMNTTYKKESKTNKLLQHQVEATNSNESEPNI